MNYQLLSNILRHKWFISQEHAMSYGPMISGILAGQEVEFKFNPDVGKDGEAHTPIVKTEEVTYFRPNKYTNFSSMPFGSVCVVGIEGPLMKADQYCGPRGMATMGDIIKKAADSKNVSAIVLQIDSPGGTVDGTKDLADLILSVEKPVVAFVDGLAASAALWIASSADEVFASQPHAEIGSVGVMLSFADLQPAWEKLGVKFHTINAPQSTEKNKVWEDLRAGKYDDFKKEVLAPLADEFIGTMKDRFPNVEDKHLKGKVFFAKDVKGVFVNQIGTLEETILRAKELSRETGTGSGSEINAKNSNKKNTTMSKFARINGAIGVENFEMVDGVASFNEEQLEAINTALENGSTLQTQLDAANAARQAAENSLATANNTIAERDATIAGHVAEIAELKDEAGEEAAVVVETAANDKTSDVVNAAHDLFASLPE